MRIAENLFREPRGVTGNQRSGRHVGGGVVQINVPLRVEHFHFNRAWMRRQGTQVVRDPANRRAGRALALPPRYLLVVRVLSGWMNILAQLDCTVGVQELARQWIPGFAPASGCAG